MEVHQKPNSGVQAPGNQSAAPCPKPDSDYENL